MKVELLWRDGREGAGAAGDFGRDPATIELPAGAACVVTGQQAGVLTGPLLTLLKAARAVSLARELSERSRRPVVPTFWIAADDHDLDEIHHTFVVNKSGEVQKLRLELSGARGAAGAVAVPADAAQRWIDELWSAAGIDAAALPPDPFRPRAGDTLSTWFARCLGFLFEGRGLVLVEPAQFGAAARPVFERALRDDGAIARALKEGGEALRARGITPPLPIEEEPPLFWIEPGARTRIRRRGDSARGTEFLIGERVVARAELLAHCGPGLPRLSANVALRPIVQAACLPAIAYVAGPHELLYYEQLRPLHALFGVPFPALVARPQATLLSVVAARALRKLGLPASELFAALDAHAKAATSATTSPLLARGEQLRGEVARYVGELLESSPSVKAAAARRAAQLDQSFAGLLERAAAALSEGEKVADLRWSALANLVRPRGEPQERLLNALPFFAEQGPALIDALLTLRGEPRADRLVPHSLLVPD